MSATLAACGGVPLNVAPVVDLSHAYASHGEAAAPAAAKPAAPDEGMYTVQKGDTLFHLAMTYHCSPRDLARWNGIDESAPLQVGQRLRVREPAAPAGAAVAAPAAAATAAAGEASAAGEAVVHAVPLVTAPSVQTRSLESVPAAEAPPAAGAAAAAPAPVAPAAAVAGGAGWIWPVDGKVLVKFDPVHGKGVDISVAEDAPVVAVADGEVGYAGSPLEYGNLIILTHPDGLRTAYAHNKTLVAKAGQHVHQGELIATAGKTGSGPALLHFEVRLRGVPVDPLEYLPAR